jgi:hypothetical protein
MTYVNDQAGSDKAGPTQQTIRRWRVGIAILYTVLLLPGICFIGTTFHEYPDTHYWSEGISHGKPVSGPASIIPSAETIAEAQTALVWTGVFAGLYILSATGLLVWGLRIQKWAGWRTPTDYLTLVSLALTIFMGTSFCACSRWFGASMWTLGQ